MAITVLKHLPHKQLRKTGWLRHRLSLLIGLSLITLLIIAGCKNRGRGLERINREVDALIAETNSTLGSEVQSPSIGRLESEPTLMPVEHAIPEANPTSEFVPTINPDSGTLTYSVSDEAADVLARLQGYDQTEEDATQLDLFATLAYAVEHSRDFRFAEEEYVLSALRLLTERHLWGPRFFNDISATVDGVADGNTFDTSLRLVNEFRVTQRLPYGGDVSVRALADATEDLHQRVAGENVQSADIILEADIPLLRGAGMVAREDKIQSERNLIYAARDFERFRRQFLFDIAQQFLNLVVQQQSIFNARRQLTRFEDLEVRQKRLVDSGRQPPFEGALAEQDTLFERDRLNSLLESYRFAVDQFKVRIGMPVEEALIIIDSELGLPAPLIDINEAVVAALMYRLDLQTERDQVSDSKRRVANARNDLLADLDFSASITLPTTDEKDRAGLDFQFDDMIFSAGITYGLPLDREIERLDLRESQINLERAIRDYNEFRDQVVVDVRRAVREIDAAIFSLQIQQENIATAVRRHDSIEAALDRSTARDRSEAASGLLRAEDERDRAERDLQVAILRYLLASGQLRVTFDGSILPLEGMAEEPESSKIPPSDAGVDNPQTVDPTDSPVDSPMDADDQTGNPPDLSK